MFTYSGCGQGQPQRLPLISVATLVRYAMECMLAYIYAIGMFISRRPPRLFFQFINPWLVAS